MRLRWLVAAAPLAVLALSAHADTLSTFSIHGASQFYGMAGDFNTITGTTTIDTTTGVVNAISFTAGGVTQSGVDFQDGTFLLVGDTSARFTISGVTLVNFTGDNFNLNGLGDFYVGQVGLVSSTTTGDPAGDPGSDPTSATPEPGSIALLGTGLLGLAGVLRRRRPEDQAAGV